MRVQTHGFGRALILTVIMAGVVGCAAEKPKAVYGLHGWCSFKPAQVEIHLAGPEGSRVIGGDIAAQLYPDRATRMDKIGTAVVSCRYVARQPSECVVVQEDGAYGFGGSAQKVAMQFAPPMSHDGTVEVRVRFVMFEPERRQASANCEDLLPNPPITDAAGEVR